MSTHENKRQVVKKTPLSNAVSQKHAADKPSLQFIDKRAEIVAQRKLQEMANNNLKANQSKDENIIQHKKSQGKGKFSAVAASPAATAVTNMFIQQHIGNQAAATQMALNRAKSIEASHTIDISETGKLLGEMQQRINNGYYIPANQVNSPYPGGLQYLTANSYKIWETKIDSRGRLKKTRLINTRFYYDVLPTAGNALHHFAGPA